MIYHDTRTHTTSNTRGHQHYQFNTTANLNKTLFQLEHTAPHHGLSGPHATNTFYYYRSYLELLCQRYSTLPPGGRLQPNILLWSYQTLQLTYRKLNSSQRNKLKLEIFNISLNPLTMIRISQVFLLSQNLTDRFTA